MPITKIISGGQTGADQGALDVAIKLGRGDVRAEIALIG